jgi:RNA polymerase primary sigma factor
VKISDAPLERSRAHQDNPADAIRARRLLGTELRYIAHPSFDDPGAHEAILAPMPAPAVARPPRRTKAPEGMPPNLASLYDEGALLSREQEAHLFRKMNYLKARASRLRDRIDSARARTTDLDEIEQHLDTARAIRSQIVRANLRLVVAIAKRHLGPHDDLFERVSDGNYALLRAVDQFDYARGNKFSTYATWAILNGLRRRKRAQKDRARFVTGHEARLRSTADTRADAHDQETSHTEHQGQVERLLGRLDDRERRILTSRYGIGGAEERTLKQIGVELGISKERVRQLETRAHQKLRGLARREELDLVPA